MSAWAEAQYVIDSINEILKDGFNLPDPNSFTIENLKLKAYSMSDGGSRYTSGFSVPDGWYISKILFVSSPYQSYLNLSPKNNKQGNTYKFTSSYGSHQDGSYDGEYYYVDSGKEKTFTKTDNLQKLLLTAIENIGLNPNCELTVTFTMFDTYNVIAEPALNT